MDERCAAADGAGKDPNVPLPAPIDTEAGRAALERVCVALGPARRRKANGTLPVAGTLLHDARMAGLFDVPGETLNGLIERVYGVPETAECAPLDAASDVVEGAPPAAQEDPDDEMQYFYREAADD